MVRRRKHCLLRSKKESEEKFYLVGDKACEEVEDVVDIIGVATLDLI